MYALFHVCVHVFLTSCLYLMVRRFLSLLRALSTLFSLTLRWTSANSWHWEMTLTSSSSPSVPRRPRKLCMLWNATQYRAISRPVSGRKTSENYQPIASIQMPFNNLEMKGECTCIPVGCNVKPSSIDMSECFSSRFKSLTNSSVNTPYTTITQLYMHHIHIPCNFPSSLSFCSGKSATHVLENE